MGKIKPRFRLRDGLSAPVRTGAKMAVVKYSKRSHPVTSTPLTRLAALLAAFLAAAPAAALAQTLGSVDFALGPARHPHHAGPHPARNGLARPLPTCWTASSRAWTPGSTPRPRRSPPPSRRASTPAPWTTPCAYRGARGRAQGQAGHRRAAHVPARARAGRAGAHARGHRPLRRDDHALSRAARALEQPGSPCTPAAAISTGPARRWAWPCRPTPTTPTRRPISMPSRPWTRPAPRPAPRPRPPRRNPATMTPRYALPRLLRLTACTLDAGTPCFPTVPAQPAAAPFIHQRHYPHEHEPPRQAANQPRRHGHHPGRREGPPRPSRTSSPT